MKNTVKKVSWIHANQKTITIYVVLSYEFSLSSRVEEEDGSIVVKVRKQYNDKADVSEYFN